MSDEVTADDERSDPPPDADEDVEVDDDELVGPGRFPLRVQPAAALQPGTGDARRLLTIWFVRKSFYWLFFVGWTIGAIAAARRHEEAEFQIQDGFSAPWAVLILAFAVRFIAGWVALALAFPLALAHEPNLSPRTNFGSGIGVVFDRLNLARAFRALRWTHHVRQVAQHRLGERGRRLGRLDPVLDVVNIASGVVAFIAMFVASALYAA